MAEQGPAAGQTEAQEGTAQAVEAGVCGLGRIWGCHPDAQGQDQESQGTVGAEVGKGCKE